jgi:hypothetical protein
MATYHKVLTPDTMNEQVKKVNYAVRGKLVLSAIALEKFGFFLFPFLVSGTTTLHTRSLCSILLYLILSSQSVLCSLHHCTPHPFLLIC